MTRSSSRRPLPKHPSPLYCPIYPYIFLKHTCLRTSSNSIPIHLQKRHRNSQTPQRPTQIQLNNTPDPKHTQRRGLFQNVVVAVHICNVDELAAGENTSGEEYACYYQRWEGRDELGWLVEGVQGVEEYEYCWGGQYHNYLLR